MRRIEKTMMCLVFIGVLLIGQVAATKTLTIAGWFPAPEKYIEMFEEQTGIDVEYIYVPDSRAYLERVVLWGIGDTLPDVLFVPYWGVNSLASHGLLRPIDDLLAADEAYLFDFLPQGLEAFRRDGGLYGLPFELNPDVVIFDPRPFEERAVLTPSQQVKNGTWTPQSLVDSARKLTELTPDESTYISIGMVTWSDQLNRLAPYVWMFGGELVSETGEEFLIGTIETKEALEEIARYFQEKIFLSVAYRTAYNLDHWEILVGNRTGMRGCDIPLLGDIASQNPQLAAVVGVVPYPMGINGEPTTGLTIHGVGITPTSQQVEEAWSFIRMILDVPSDGASIPVRQSQFGDWIQRVDTAFPGIDALSLMQQLNAGMRLGPRILSQDMEYVVRTDSHRAMIGRISVVQAIENALAQLSALQ